MSDYDISDGLIECYLSCFDIEISIAKDKLAIAVMAERFAMGRREAAYKSGDVFAINRARDEWHSAKSRRDSILDTLEAYCIEQEKKRQKRLRECVFELPREDDTGWDAPYGLPGKCRMCGRAESEHGVSDVTE